MIRGGKMNDIKNRICIDDEVTVYQGKNKLYDCVTVLNVPQNMHEHWVFKQCDTEKIIYLRGDCIVTKWW